MAITICKSPSLLSILLLLLCSLLVRIDGHDFTIEEATIEDVQRAFTEKTLTSRRLVEYYLNRIEILNPVLRSVIEVNPDALAQAERADIDRQSDINRSRSSLHGVPVLLKDSIATEDKLNTTAGSYALLGAVAPRDAGVVERLRKAGAVILGKASMSEWYHFRSPGIPDGWCARGGQSVNPYIWAASRSDLVASRSELGRESMGTGSRLHHQGIGSSPRFGSRTNRRTDHFCTTIGPICRTVSDAAHVLDFIVGFDPRDSEATKAAAKFIPMGGYTQFLNEGGLKGKRLGVLKDPLLALPNVSSRSTIFEAQLQTMRAKDATIVDNLEIPNIDIIMNPLLCGEALALLAEFKLSLNGYLKELTTSSVRSLSDVIIFNQNNPDLERSQELGQDILIAANSTNGIGEEERGGLDMMANLSRDGFEKLMSEHELDALVTLGWDVSTVLAIGGFPAVTVPSGYDSNGMPFGICFGGLKGSEPALIEIAYAFEQATLVREQPPLKLVDFFNACTSENSQGGLYE
ncbi:hypothetical protein OROMI_033103 [Orobanche minor]